MDLSEGDIALLNVQLNHWISVSLEIADIASKVLDWKSFNPRFKGKSNTSSSSSFGIKVCKEYLLLLEEISYQCDRLGREARNKQKVKTQTLMYEVFKRVVNTEVLADIGGESALNLDDNAGQENKPKEKKVASGKRDQEEFIPNYNTPAIRA